jgi:nitroreductase
VINIVPLTQVIRNKSSKRPPSQILISDSRHLNLMNFEDVLQGRRSVRRYKEDPVPEDKISDLLEAAETAPSAGNLRAREYFVVTRPDLRTMLSVAAYGQGHVATAPVLIVVCADPIHSGRRYGDRGQLYSIQDAAAATTCLLLAAQDMGLGACWTGAFDDDMVKEILKLPDRLVPTAIVSLGWPDEKPSPPPRRKMEDIVHWMTD